MLGRFLSTAAAVAIVTYLVDGIQILGQPSLTDEVLTVLGVAAIFGLINAVVKPIFSAVTAPLIILSLGLFILVINTLLVLATSWVCGQIGLAWHVDGLWSAFLGALGISVVSFVLNFFVGRRR